MLPPGLLGMRMGYFMQMRRAATIQSKRHATATRLLLECIPAAAALSFPSSAVARDAGPYVGIEGGFSFPNNLRGNASVDAVGIGFVCLPGKALCDEVPEHFVVNDAVAARLKRGADADVIAGYDFGPVRLEAELGWKRLTRGGLKIDASFLDYFNAALRRPSVPPDPGAPGMAGLTSSDFEGLDGKVVAKSAMVNLLADLAGPARFSFYGGGGFGRTWAKALKDSDSAWAAQAIVGIRTSISPNVNLGLKYRYFRTGRLNFVGGPLEVSGNPYVAFAGGLMFVKRDSAAITPEFGGRLHSHSLLASLTFNFGPPARR
jgi:opacity protein-like surface antigen